MAISILIPRFARNLKGVFCESKTENIPNEPGQVMLPRDYDKLCHTLFCTPDTKVVIRFFYV
jgi:hypothetical protein